MFRRSVGYLPLPRPVRRGSLDRLWEILRIGQPDTQALAGGWLVAAYFADVSRPGLWPTGAPGSGKSTAAGGLARLVDGLEWLDGALDRSDDRNNIIRAAKCYVPSFDNMSGVTADQSNWICYLVTGHRDMFRRMRTNFDDISMAYKRTFVATGLSLPYGLGADALDRIIEAPTESIPAGRRVSDETIRAELDAARGTLLGALLDHVSGVLRELPRPDGPELAGLRMHSYARLLAAHDRAFGTGSLAAYKASLRNARADKASSEPVVRALAAWMSPGAQWNGTAGDLLEALPVSTTTPSTAGLRRAYCPHRRC